jgi:iron complex outermembrane receptor protein
MSSAGAADFPNLEKRRAAPWWWWCSVGSWQMRFGLNGSAAGVLAAALLVGVSHLPLAYGQEPTPPADATPPVDTKEPADTEAPAEATPPATTMSKREGVETVTVTARRRVENVQKVPVAVTPFSGEKLIERNMKTVEDVARETPSLNIQSRILDTSQKSFSLRGQVQNDQLVTLDPSVGVYLNDQYMSRSAGANLDFFDVERVEVLAGPQGTLYGRNTTGGAIKVITAAPDPDAGFSGYVAGQYGEFDLYRFEGAANIALSEDFAIRIAALRTARDGYSTTFVGRHSDPAGADAFDQYNGAYPFCASSSLPCTPPVAVDTDNLDTTAVRFSALGNLSDKLSINVVADWSKQDTNGGARINRGGDLVTAPVGGLKFFGNAHAVAPCNSTDFYTTCSDITPFSTIDAWGVGVTAAYEIDDKATLKLIYGHRDADGAFASSIAGTGLFFTGSRLYQTSSQDSVEGQLLGEIDWLKYIAGVYWLSEDANEEQFSKGASIGGCTPLDADPSCLPGSFELERKIEGDVTNDTFAIYGQGTIALSETVDLTLGARYTEDEKTIVAGTFLLSNPGLPTGFCVIGPTAPPFPVSLATCNFQREKTFTHLSWTASLDWEATEDLLLYVKGSNGYRAGGHNLRAVTPAMRAPFDPETVTDVEVGAKWDLLDDRLRLNTAYYHSFYEDIQVSLLVQVPGVGLTTQVVNLAEADVDGVELQARFFLTPELSVDGTASWLNFEYTDPLLVPQLVPDYKYNVGATYDLPVSYGTWTVHGGYSYQDDYCVTSFAVVAAGNPFACVDGRGLVDGRITLDLEEHGLQLALFGTNLTDEEYYEVPLTGSNGNTVPPAIPSAFVNSTFNTATVGAPRILGVEVRKQFGGD